MNNGNASGVSGVLFEVCTHTQSVPQCMSATRQLLRMPVDAGKGGNIEALPPDPPPTLTS